MGDTAMSSSWRKDRGGAVAAGLEGAPLGSSRAHSYIIQSGDTLWEIAYERNLSVETLLKYNPTLDAECIQPGDRVHLPSSDELLRGMMRRVPPAPLPAPSHESEGEEIEEVLEDEGDWPPAGSKVHHAIMRRHQDKPPAIVVVAGTIAVAVALRVLACALRKNRAAPASDQVTPVKSSQLQRSRGRPIRKVIGAVGKCAAFVRDTVGKVLILETESGSPPATPELPQKPAAPVFRSDPRHSAREEPSQAVSSSSADSGLTGGSARSDSSSTPSMADILLVVKRAGGGGHLTARSTTRDVAVEIERALVRLARDKTKERERFDRNHVGAPGPVVIPQSAAVIAAAAAERAALQQELQAALSAVAAFKEAETIQAAMAAEANARCAQLELTLAEERAKVARLLAQEKESAREAAAFQSPPATSRTVPDSPSEASPDAQTGGTIDSRTGVQEAFRMPLGSRAPAEARVSSYGGESYGGGSQRGGALGGSYGNGGSFSQGTFRDLEAEAIAKRAADAAAEQHAAAALKAMTAAVEALDAAMEFDAASPEAPDARKVTVKVRQQDWSLSQSNQSMMRYTAAESSAGSGNSRDTPETPPLEADTLSPQSAMRQPEILLPEAGDEDEEPSPPPMPVAPSRVSSGVGFVMAQRASLRGVSGSRSSSSGGPCFSYT